MEKVYIVENINQLRNCPKCNYDFLNSFETRLGNYKSCPNCNKQYVDKFSFVEVCDLTQPDETEKAPAKEQLIQELHEEVDNLRWCIWDAKSDLLVNNITYIFNKLIEYIENN